MLSKPMLWKLLAGLVVVAVLAGCGPAPTPLLPTSTPPPTVDARPTLNAVATQAVQTAMANLTLNAPTATPVTPTSTPEPTSTTGPTNTPAPTQTPTRAFIPWTPTPTATQAAYACAVTGVSPKSTDTIKVDQDFDGKWSLKNTGTKTWSSNSTDFRFTEGADFRQDKKSPAIYDLSGDVAPNGTYTFVMDMKAPSSDGSYTSTWGLYLEDGTVCTLTLTINVSK